MFFANGLVGTVLNENSSGKSRLQSSSSLGAPLISNSTFQIGTNPLTLKEYPSNFQRQRPASWISACLMRFLLNLPAPSTSRWHAFVFAHVAACVEINYYQRGFSLKNAIPRANGPQLNSVPCGNGTSPVELKRFHILFASSQIPLSIDVSIKYTQLPANWISVRRPMSAETDKFSQYLVSTNNG